ncbi:TPM domain-containing protein [Nitrosomonadaceae bacterium]|nr:TPM domain-containing protein [Nitrosomonadaceae bacterium]
MINFNQSDLDQISKAVLEAERHTTGEIVPMVIKQSDDYPGARWRLAIVISLLFGFLVYSCIDYSDSVWILWAQIPGLYIGYWLGTFDTILKPFLSDSKIDEEVHQRALQAFFSHNIHATKERTGILIMVSLLEHRVEILADTGINAKVSKDTWQKILTDMVSKIKSNELADGICIAVKECGEILAKDFPGTHENPNEIKNKIIIE